MEDGAGVHQALKALRDMKRCACTAAAAAARFLAALWPPQDAHQCSCARCRWRATARMGTNSHALTCARPADL